MAAVWVAFTERSPSASGTHADLERAGLVAAVEQSADAIVICDCGGTIQYVNPAFTAMTGYSCEEAIGQNPRILKSGLQPAGIYKDLWDTVTSGGVWQGELINRRKDGSLYTEEMRIAPVRAGTGITLSVSSPSNGTSPTVTRPKRRGAFWTQS